MRRQCDFLVLGSGIAGLSFALRAAEVGTVLVVTKKSSSESATNYAQGGIAAVVADDDSLESHVADTLRAGAGLCDEGVVRFVVERGREAIQGLIDLGVHFDQRAGGPGFDLGKEGGHSHRRVLHAADFTGQEIERVLVQRCQEHPRIEILTHCLAVDLVTSEKLGLPGQIVQGLVRRRLHCTGLPLLLQIVGPASRDRCHAPPGLSPDLEARSVPVKKLTSKR